MSFIKVHGLKLANGAYVENAVFEQLGADLAGADLTAASAGRVYYNSDSDKFMGVFDDGVGGKELRAFAAGGDVDAFIADLGSNDEGKGADMVGYDGNTGNTYFSLAASGLGDSVDAIVDEIDSIEENINTIETTMATYDGKYVDVAGDTMSGELAMGANKITGLADPTADQDAATKAYVDAARLGLDAKESVRVATTASDDLDLATGGLLTIDGVTLLEGDRVLVKDQTDATQNGLYTASAGAWVRTEDADEPEEVTANIFTFVSEGTALADTGWVLTTNDPITIGTHDLTFVQFSAPGQYQAGVALSKNGLVFDVDVDGSTIVVNGSDQLAIASDYLDAVNASITAIETEVDAIEAGAGLAADGSYVVNTGSETLSGATSLADADDKLGAAVEQVATDLAALGSGSITNLQAEVDAIETASGGIFDENGAFDVTAIDASGWDDPTGTGDPAAQVASQTDLAGVIEALGYQTALVSVPIAGMIAATDKVEASVGLSVDGDYVPDTTSEALSGATTVADSIKLLDDEVEALKAASGSDITDLKTEVDNIETAVGLDADGNFVSFASAALSGSATIKEALEALDAKQVTDDAGDLALQSELDATQAGAGLDVDGNYVADTGSETISGAATLAAADSLLASAIESLKSDVESSVFHYTAGAPAMQHVIAHNLDSDFVEAQVWVLDTDSGKYMNDLVAVTVDNANQLTVDLTEAQTVRVIVRK